MPEMAPTVVPFIITEAPGIDAPVDALVIIPVTVFPCAKESWAQNRINSRLNAVCFIHYIV